MYKVFSVAAFCSLSLITMGQNRTELKSSIERGKMVYEQYCLACHQVDGSGVPQLTPPLIKTGFVLGDKVRLIQVIIKGLKDTEVDGESYENPMPAFEFLNDKEVADVLTYVRKNFNNAASAVKPEEILKVRKSK